MVTVVFPTSKEVVCRENVIVTKNKFGKKELNLKIEVPRNFIKKLKDKQGEEDTVVVEIKLPGVQTVSEFTRKLMTDE